MDGQNYTKECTQLKQQHEQSSLTPVSASSSLSSIVLRKTRSSDSFDAMTATVRGKIPSLFDSNSVAQMNGTSAISSPVDDSHLYTLFPLESKISILSASNQEELLLGSSANERPTSAPPDLETNSIFNSTFLSSIMEKSNRDVVGSSLTNGGREPLVSSVTKGPATGNIQDVGLSETPVDGGGLAPCSTATSLAQMFSFSHKPGSTQSVELDLEKLICDDVDSDRASNDHLDRFNDSGGGSVMDDITGRQETSAVDEARLSRSSMSEKLLGPRLMHPHGSIFPSLQNGPTSDFTPAAVESLPKSSRTSFLEGTNDYGERVRPGLSHIPTLWKPSLDPTNSITPGGHKNFSPPCSGNTLTSVVTQLQDSVLVQHHRHPQFLNFQMRVTSMGAATTSSVPSYPRPVSYTAIPTQQGRLISADGRIPDPFFGLQEMATYLTVSHPSFSTTDSTSATTTTTHFNASRSHAEKMAVLSRIEAEELVKSNAYVGCVYALAKKDQAGCRVLQKKLDDGDPVHINQIFSECLKYFSDLMADPFGNYLCQKLMEVISDEQLGQLVKRISSDIPQISVKIHGTRASQALIERVGKSSHIHLIIESLRGNVVSLVKDPNGNHVIQKCLTALEYPTNQFIYDDLISNCVEVAVHRHGCCVLQRAIDSATLQQRNYVVEGICRHALQLMQDAFGNYVVQYVLDLKEEATNDAIICRILGNVATLSKQKFASNVIEKCLTLGSDSAKCRLVGELLDDGPQCVQELLLDPYGNYVIQRALQVSRDPQFSRLIDVIRVALPQLKQTLSGKRIALKLAKKYPELTSQNPIPTGIASYVGSVGLAGLEQLGMSSDSLLSGLSTTPINAAFLTANPYIALPHATLNTSNVKTLSSLHSRPIASTYWSTADFQQVQLSAAEQNSLLFPLDVSAPFGRVGLLNTSSLQATQEFSRLQQQQRTTASMTRTFDTSIGGSPM